MRILGALLTLLLLTVPASALHSPTRCDTITHQIKGLNERYKENIVGRGLLTERILLQHWTNRDGETWTVTVTYADRDALCIIAVGYDWETIKWIEPPGEAS